MRKVRSERAASEMRKDHPSCQIFGQTVTTDHHDELIRVGISPSSKGTKGAQKFPYVIFCAPPYQTVGYPGDVREAASSWNGEGSFLFTSSSAPYDCYDNGQCDEDSPVVPIGKSTRTDVLLKAEKVALEFGGCVLRLAGLYKEGKGAHAYWLEKGIVDSRPDHILNLIHYQDAASFSISILKKKLQGRIFLGCDNHPLSMSACLAICFAILFDQDDSIHSIPIRLPHRLLAPAAALETAKYITKQTYTSTFEVHPLYYKLSAQLQRQYITLTNIFFKTKTPTTNFADKMGDHIITLREVHPQTKKWTTKIQVLEKSFPRTSKNSKSFQRLILGDCEGTRIQATIFGSDIGLFERSFKQYHKYHISNALVKPIQTIYRIVENSFQWTINGATLVEEIESTNNDAPMFNFTPFTELHSQRDSDSSVGKNLTYLKL